MIAYRFAQNFQKAIDALDNDSFFGYLSKINNTSVHDISPDELILIASNLSGGQFPSDLLENLISLKNGTVTYLRKEINHVEFVESLLRFSGKLDTEYFSLNNVDTLKADLALVRDSYNKFMGEYEDGYNAAITFIKASNSLYEKLKAHKDNLYFVISNFYEHETLKNNFLELSLYFSRKLTARELATKISVISDMYSEVCQLFGVDESDYPLEIVKVETGSFFSKITGNKIVITFIIGAITQTGLFAYRNYTTEGKIRSTDERMEILRKEYEFAKEMEKNGYSPDKTQISKNFNAISKQLGILLNAEPSFEVNGEKHSLPEELKQQYIEQTKTPLLEHTDWQQPELQPIEQENK